MELFMEKFVLQIACKDYTNMLLNVNCQESKKVTG